MNIGGMVNCASTLFTIPPPPPPPPSITTTSTTKKRRSVPMNIIRCHSCQVTRMTKTIAEDHQNFVKTDIIFYVNLFSGGKRERMYKIKWERIIVGEWRMPDVLL